MQVRKVLEKDYDLYAEMVSSWKLSLGDCDIFNVVREFFVRDFFPLSLNKYLARQVTYSLKNHEKRHVYFYKRQFIECYEKQKTLALAMIEESDGFVDVMYLCVHPKNKTGFSDFEIIVELVFQVFLNAEKCNRKIRFSPLLEDLQIDNFLFIRGGMKDFSIQ